MNWTIRQPKNISKSGSASKMFSKMTTTRADRKLPFYKTFALDQQQQCIFPFLVIFTWNWIVFHFKNWTVSQKGVTHMTFQLISSHKVCGSAAICARSENGRWHAFHKMWVIATDGDCVCWSRSLDPHKSASK